MKVNKDNMLKDAELDLMFDAVRDTPPLPSDDLWARVHADSLAMMPEALSLPPALQPTSFPAARAGLLAGLMAAIGGWPSVAGLTTAAMAGVWVGFANPDALDGLSQAGLLPGISAGESYDLEDLAPGIGGFATLLEDG